MSELRWDARLGEWVIIAPHRQDRIYHPEGCPLCPTRPGGGLTELPDAEFDIAVFENRFPSLRLPAEPVSEGPGVAPAAGRCEVVVFTPEHEGSLGALPPERIDALLRVWAHRYEALSRLEGVRYVFIFENRGAEIGVTLSHPHGQIYAYSFVPPNVERELVVEAAHRNTYGGCLHCGLLERELADGQRIVFDDGVVSAYIPFAAHWPYEVQIVPRQHRTSLIELTIAERRSLGTALKSVLQAYDRLFDRPMPYLLAIRQRPIAHDARDAHLRIELLPALRAEDKLKFRAGSETFMGVFINDIWPEQAAASLRSAMTE